MITNADKKLMVQMFARGWKQQELGDYFGVDHTTIAYHLESPDAPIVNAKSKKPKNPGVCRDCGTATTSVKRKRCRNCIVVYVEKRMLKEQSGEKKGANEKKRKIIERIQSRRNRIVRETPSFYKQILEKQKKFEGRKRNDPYL